VRANVAVELDGCTFTLDEAAFAALRAYLDKAAARLGDHPDRAEALSGLERSIAGKLGRNRGTQNLVDGREMNAALAAVGRVDGPALGSRGDDADARAPRRRLYRLRDGQKVAGVCAGLAAFTNIDVSLIRLGFILGTLFSGGGLLVAYMACLFLMPVATTPEEIAAAHSGRAMV
jgi:phage shock protein PspC (stress-responsive transcriptional regulator)